MPFDKKISAMGAAFEFAEKLESEGTPYTITIYDVDGDMLHVNVRPTHWYSSGVAIESPGVKTDTVAFVNLNNSLMVEFSLSKPKQLIPGDK